MPTFFGELVALALVALFTPVALLRPTVNGGKHFPIFHFAEKPALLPVRGDNGKVRLIPLGPLLVSRCKSLFSEYIPQWWLFNGHLQTLYCILGDFTHNDQVWYRRTYLRLADGGTLGLDFAPVDQSLVKADAPIIVVQHGLTGGSYEPYIRAILSRACAPVEAGGLGYRAVVINFRGCAGVPVTSPLLYSAGHTDDTRQALAYISNQYPNARLLGLGFSMGANVLTRYLAEEGSQSRLQSGIALACPWNLKLNGDTLDKSFIGRNLYSRGMGANFLKLMTRHLDALLADPESEVVKATIAALELKVPTLDTFDNTFTRVAGGHPPPFPFPDVAAYYTWVSSDHVVGEIKVPFLALNAADDPVVRHVPMNCRGNPLVVMGLTKNGGHLGWFKSGSSHAARWTTEPTLEWLKLMGEDIIEKPNPSIPALFTDDTGFIRERGREKLGCMVIGRGALIDGNAGEPAVSANIEEDPLQ